MKKSFQSKQRFLFSNKKKLCALQVFAIKIYWTYGLSEWLIIKSHFNFICNVIKWILLQMMARTVIDKIIAVWSIIHIYMSMLIESWPVPWKKNQVEENANLQVQAINFVAEQMRLPILFILYFKKKPEN